jgi:hypothetical protein
VKYGYPGELISNAERAAEHVFEWNG